MNRERPPGTGTIHRRSDDADDFKIHHRFQSDYKLTHFPKTNRVITNHSQFQLDQSSERHEDIVLVLCLIRNMSDWYVALWIIDSLSSSSSPHSSRYGCSVTSPHRVSQPKHERTLYIYHHKLPLQPLILTRCLSSNPPAYSHIFLSRSFSSLAPFQFAGAFPVRVLAPIGRLNSKMWGSGVRGNGEIKDIDAVNVYKYMGQYTWFEDPVVHPTATLCDSQCPPFVLFHQLRP